MSPPCLLCGRWPKRNRSTACPPYRDTRACHHEQGISGAAVIRILLSVIAFGGLAGCGGALAGSFGSLGGDTAGERGTLGVLFINNTPYRALLTAGTFDPADENSNPTFVQFGSDPSRRVLEGGTSSEVVSLTCARVFSVGGEALIARIRATADENEIDATAMNAGIGFSSAPMSDDDAGVANQGRATARTFVLGADFPCNALLIVRLEVADTGTAPFTFRFSYIPSESTR